MTHYRALVTLKPGQSLNDALAPFDENLEVEPYRDYEEGEPGEQWYWDAEDGDNPTWPQVAGVWNAQYGDEGEMLLDDDGRAYRMSTRNPQSKWDWWKVGGRWPALMRVSAAYDGDPGIVRGELSWGADDMDKLRAGGPLNCDGGPKRILDLELTRGTAAARKSEAFDEFHALIKDVEAPKPWSHYLERHKADEDGYPIEQARSDFHHQPAVLALGGSEFRFYAAEAIAMYCRPREVVLAEARTQAIPGYALLTLDGAWWEPGEMGMFAASTDTPESKAEYLRRANAYVDALSDDIILINVDVHI
jgi:hypothetical protein